MAVQLDPDSWVRLPVPLSNLPEEVEPASESFTPAYTLELASLPADIDDEAILLALPRNGDDVLVTDRVFAQPIQPISVIEPLDQRTVTRLKCIEYPYALTAAEGAEEDLRHLASAATASYPVSVAYIGSKARASTEVTDQAPPAPAALNIASGSAAPVLGSGKVPYGDPAMDDWQAPFDGRDVYPPDDYWDWNEKEVFSVEGHLTLNGTQYTTGAVMSESYIAFPDTATLTWNVSPTSPAFDKLVVAGGDLDTRLIAVQIGTNYVKVRNEIGEWSGVWDDATGLAPLIVWEATFFEPLEDGTQYIEVRIGELDQATLNLLVDDPDYMYVFSKEVYLSSKTGTVYATATLAPETSYVFVGNATGTQWAVQTGAHITNNTGFYAKKLQVATRTRALVAEGTPINLTTRTQFGEKPTEFFASLMYTGTSAAATRSVPGLYPLMVWNKHDGTEWWFGGPVFNAGGAYGVTGTDPNGGTPGKPKAKRLSYTYDVSPASLETGGFLSFAKDSYQVGSTVNFSTPTNRALAWVFGAYGPPQVNADGLEKGGRLSTVSSGPCGISFFSYTGVSSVDLPTSGLAIGHGLRDEDGNSITPDIVFVTKYFYNSYLRNPIGVMGRVLPQIVYTNGTTANRYLELAKRDSFNNLATAAAGGTYVGATTEYLRGDVADEKVIYLGSGGNSANATLIAMAMANIPGSCAVKTFISAGNTNEVELGFQPNFVILKSITSTSNWVVFGEQSYMSGKSLNLHTSESPITTNGTGTLTSYGLTWTRTNATDQGQQWLVIAVSGKRRGNRAYGLRAESGDFTRTGQNAFFTSASALKVSGDAGALALTGQEVGLTYLRALRISAEAAEFGLTGEAAELWLPRALVISAEAGSFAISGTVAVLSPAITIKADGAALTLSGEASSLTKDYRIEGRAGLFAVTGVEALFVYLRVFEPLVAEAAGIALAGQEAWLKQTETLKVDGGSFALTGGAANLVREFRVEAGSGSFTTQGQETITAEGDFYASWALQTFGYEALIYPEGWAD